MDWEQIGNTTWIGYGKVLWIIREEARPVHYVETGETVANHGFYLRTKNGYNSMGMSATLAKAKQLAATKETELPLYEVEPADGSEIVEYLAFESDVVPKVPQSRVIGRLLRPCEECGAENSVVELKPVHGSAAWWDDPMAYWICARCRNIRHMPYIYPDL